MEIKFKTREGDVIAFKVLEYQIRENGNCILFSGMESYCIFHSDGEIQNSTTNNLEGISILGQKWKTNAEGFESTPQEFKATIQDYKDLLQKLTQSGRLD